MAVKNKLIKAVPKEKKKRKSKSESIAMLNYAFILFCSGMSQKDIAARCEVSEKTISEWKQKYDWESKRASKTVSMDELVNKCLVKINDMLDSNDFNADNFAKAVAQLKSLKPSNTIDNIINSFLKFQDFLLEIRHEEDIPEELIKTIVALQDRFVKTKLNLHA